jgi:hypothetical protein
MQGGAQTRSKRVPPQLRATLDGVEAEQSASQRIQLGEPQAGRRPAR